MAYRKTRSSRRPVTRRATTRRPTRKASRPWTREEIAFLRKNYRMNETKWVARQLGRTVYAVRYKASDLSIRKANPSQWRGNTGNSKKTTRRPATRTRKPARRQTQRTRWAKPARRTARRSTTRRTTRRTKK